MAERAGRCVHSESGELLKKLTEGLHVFAAHQFDLSQAIGDHGVTKREHLQQVQRQTGETPTDLQGPQCPPALEYIWQWFLELHQSRGHSMNGPLPLSHQELAAWAQLTQRPLSILEVRLLKSLDQQWLECIHA